MAISFSEEGGGKNRGRPGRKTSSISLNKKKEGGEEGQGKREDPSALPWEEEKKKKGTKDGRGQGGRGKGGVGGGGGEGEGVGEGSVV